MFAFVFIKMAPHFDLDNPCVFEVFEVWKALNYMKCISTVWIYISGAVGKLADLLNIIYCFKGKGFSLQR